MSKQIFLPESICEIDSNMDLEKLSIIYKNHSTVIGKVIRLDFDTQRFIIDLGGKITAIMPFEDSTIYTLYNSHNSFSANITHLFKKVIQAKISVFEENNIVLSRKNNMLEALESFKDRKDVMLGIVTGFSRLSAFVDIGAGIISRCYSKNFCNTIFKSAEDVGIKKGEMIPIKIIDFLEDSNRLEASRVQALPNCTEILKIKDVVRCKVFTPVGDDLGYYVLIDTIFCGIVDSPNVKLHYGEQIEALIKSINPKGPKLRFIKKVKEF